MSKRVAGLVAALVLVGSGCTYMLRADGGTGDDAPRINSLVLSHDARYVAFSSNRPELGSNPGAWDVYERDTRTGQIEAVTHGEAGTEFGTWPAAVSADGSRVLYQRAYATVPGDTDTIRTDVFLWTRGSGSVRVSVAADGGLVNGFSNAVAMSDDGDTVMFNSDASNIVAGDTNAQTDGFVRHVAAGTNHRVTLRADGSQIPHVDNAETFAYDLTADGTTALVTTDQPLVASDTNGTFDSYTRVLVGGATQRVTVADDESQLADSAYAGNRSMTPDGRYVLFTRTAPDLSRNVWLRDRTLGTTERVDRRAGETFAETDAFASGISDDGRFVLVYGSSGDPFAGTAESHLVLRDRANGRRMRVSADPRGNAVRQLWADAQLSGDGRYASFVTPDAVVPWDTNGSADDYLRAALQPIVETATPDAGSYAPGSDGSVTITGAYLYGGIAPDLGPGVTVTGVDLVGETQATVHFHVGVGATPGLHDLVFVNAGTGPGGVGAAGAFEGAFTVGS